MKTDFSIIHDFLERFGPEVSARGGAMLAPDFTAKLDRFARGDCDPVDRAAMCDLLRREPTYLRLLANRVKQLRATPEAETASGEPLEV